PGACAPPAAPPHVVVGEAPPALAAHRGHPRPRRRESNARANELDATGRQQPHLRPSASSPPTATYLRPPRRPATDAHRRPVPESDHTTRPRQAGGPVRQDPAPSLGRAPRR